MLDKTTGSQVAFPVVMGVLMLFVEHFLGRFNFWTDGPMMYIAATFIGVWILIAMLNSWDARPAWLSWIVPGSTTPAAMAKLMRVSLVSGCWELCFRPDAPQRDDGGRKLIIFLSNGDIGGGRNTNEWTWSTTGKELSLWRKSGQLHNTFRWNEDTNRFESTNSESFATKEHHILGQYIAPAPR